MTQIQEAEQASLPIKRSGAVLSLRIFKVLFFLNAWLFYLPSVHAAEFAPCTSAFSCYFFPPSQWMVGGYRAEQKNPFKKGIEQGTPDFPLILWGRPLQIHFLVKETIPEDLTKKIVEKFIEGLEGLKLYETFPQAPNLTITSVKESKALYNPQQKPKTDAYLSLGISRYLKQPVYFFPHIVRYSKVSELDFLKPDTKENSLQKPSGGNIFITISEFDPSIEFTGDKDIHPTYIDSTYIDYPKNVIHAFSKERYVAETRLSHSTDDKVDTFVGCDTRVFISALNREIFGMIMHIQLRPKEWLSKPQTISSLQGCVPLIFALPLPYKYASQALEKIMNANSHYYDLPMLPISRVKDLVSQ